MARKSISKKMRFEVLKRDSFTCQYCGAKAPDVLLEIDHIHPVAKGGKNTLLNLVAACTACNSGKSDRTLSDNSVIDKQRAQLEELQARREQLDQMFKWQQGLEDLKKSAIDGICDVFEECFPGRCVNDNGKKTLSKLVRQFSVDEVIAAIRIACDQYCILDSEGNATGESSSKAFDKFGGICRLARLDKEDPDQRRLYYIRGILRNRFTYCDQALAMSLLRQAVDLNASIDSLDECARTARNWSDWKNGILQYICDHKADGPMEGEQQ